MKLKFFVLATVITMLIPGIIIAQDCQSYYPVKQGTVTEITNYNSYNYVTGMTRQTVLSNEAMDNGYIVTVKSEGFDSKYSPTGTSEFTYACKGGKFSINMKSFLDPKSSSAYKNMNATISATDMEMPSSPTVGTSLGEGSVTVAISGSGLPSLNIDIRVFNRKVAATEKVTTPAGTFDCIKITYEVETKSIVNMTTKGTDWYAPETGCVKSESYDENGKMIIYSQITKIIR